jgi:hypothetical protein
VPKQWCIFDFVAAAAVAVIFARFFFSACIKGI